MEELEDAIMGPEGDAPVESADVAALLRETVVDAPIESEDVAALIRETFEALEALDHVDIESLSAWTVAGISLFPRGRLPRLSTVVDEAQRVLMTRAHQIFGGNITHVSRAISVGRKTARRLLERYGLNKGATRTASTAVH